MPQSWGGWWNSDRVDAYLEYIIENYRVDQSRIYITGFSAGGAGAFKYAVEFPDKVTAIVPISGRGESLDVCNMADVPVWAFHNADDTAFGAQFSIIPINKLNNCDPSPVTKAKITIYPVSGHDAWTKTYDGSGTGTGDPAYDAFDSNVYDWLLQFAKDTVIADAGEDKVIFQPQTSLEIEAYVASYNGNHTYAWQQVDGLEVEIQNPASPTLSVENMSEGRYTFAISAENDLKEVTTDTVKVWVRPPNVAPSVTTTDKIIILPVDSVTLLGIVNDPEGDAFSLNWSQQTGPEGAMLQVDNLDYDSTKLILRNLTEGEYTFQLSATDQYDSIGRGSVNLRVITRPEQIIDNLPYQDSFEDSDKNLWQSYGTSNSWAQGQPSGSIINLASNESKVWATNPTGDYQIGESSFLLSPVFDFSDLSNDPTIHYNVWTDIAPGDSTYFSVTFNQGATWDSYNLADENTNDGWMSVSRILEGVAGQESVLFRIGIESNSTEGYDGIAIDNMLVCSAGGIVSLTDTLVVGGESLEVPIELDNSDITESIYQVNSSNQDILPDENLSISEGILKISSLPQTEGETKITVSSPQICISETTFTLTVARVTALNDPEKNSQTLLYPNPGTGYYQVESKETIKEARLYNPEGQLLERYQPETSSNKNLSFNIYNHPNGIYYLQVETAKNISTKKMIKY